MKCKLNCIVLVKILKITKIKSWNIPVHVGRFQRKS